MSIDLSLLGKTEQTQIITAQDGQQFYVTTYPNGQKVTKLGVVVTSLPNDLLDHIADMVAQKVMAMLNERAAIGRQKKP